MKNRKNGKIFSAFAVLAISATCAFSAIPLAGCNDKASSDVPVSTGGKVVVDTAAYGSVQQKSSGKKYFIAPNGDNSKDGESIENAKALAFLSTDTLRAGDTVYLLPGVYSGMTQSIDIIAVGEFNSYIRIVNAALDKEGSGYTGTGKEVVLDFSAMTFASTNRGVQIKGNYIYWYGIDICGAGDNGMYVGGSYNTVDYCEFYNNRDTGLQLGRSAGTFDTINLWPSYNLIKNCTSHNNYDNETTGENADGFAAKLTVGYGNVFDGCIAYRNSDDGWDLFAKSDSGNIGAVILYNCVAYENGYLEYTQRENNKRFGDKWNSAMSEDEENPLGKNSYETLNGDGNGFKLGGSVMEGDVVMYNCLSFQNRMHGVTDNSNPGFIKVTNVTSYDNSAAVDNNPESATFGKIISTANGDTHANIDVARQTYSYNSLNRVLSVKSDIAKSLSEDAYRGSVSDSLLIGKSKANVIDGKLDASTKTDSNGNFIGTAYTSQKNALVAADVFKTLPVTKEGEVYTHNIDGLKDLYVTADGAETGLNPQRAHLKFRNGADYSINMGDILAQKDEFAHGLASLDAETAIGSQLNKDSWEGYNHHYAKDFVDDDAESAEQANVNRAKEALTLSTEESAVYQNFEVPMRMLDCNIEWSVAESAKDYLKVAMDGDNVVSSSSVSGSRYGTIIVTRPVTENVTLTDGLIATVKSDKLGSTVKAERAFTLTIIAGTPQIGKIEVRAYENDALVGDAIDAKTMDKLLADADDSIEFVYSMFTKLVGESMGNVIIDQFSACGEPEIAVRNGMYDDVRYLAYGDEAGQVKVDKSYVFFQKDANSNPALVPCFTSSNAGVFTIFKSVSINGGNGYACFVYRIYVASSSAKVDFAETPTVTVNRNGFEIDGKPSSAKGTLYVLASNTELSDLTAEAVAADKNAQKAEFKTTHLTSQFANANSGEYYIYYVLANTNGKVTSKLYSTKINSVNVTSTADFMKLAGGDKIGEETPSETIYFLTCDLDFTDVEFNRSANAFRGLLNGMGHTVKNISITSTGGNNVGVFYKVGGGTIENIKFENVSITAKGQKVGLVTECDGGYFYNIAIKNINIEVAGGQRIGALIGQANKGDTVYVERVSVDNDAEHAIRATNSGTRVAGLVAFSQSTSSDTSGTIDVRIKNCFVRTDLEANNEIGGIYCIFEPASPLMNFRLEIESCVYNGNIIIKQTSAGFRAGGILGYEKGAYGDIRIAKCISICTFIFDGKPVTESLKNSSGILGAYSLIHSGNGKLEVVDCAALTEEHNTDCDVEVFSTSTLVKSIVEGRLDTKYWSYAFQEGSTSLLQLPLATLIFEEVAQN